MRLVSLDASPGSGPKRHVGQLEANEQDSIVGAEHERARSLAKAALAHRTRLASSRNQCRRSP
jgi:hypothetical protein